MDNSQLLKAFKEHLDEKVDLIRQDVKELSGKQINHEIRIDRLEGMAGYVKISVATALSAIGTFIAYVAYKMIDFWTQKS